MIRRSVTGTNRGAGARGCRPGRSCRGGCGGSPGPAYYVWAGAAGQSQAVLLVQWSQPQGGQVRGTLTSDSIDMSAAPQESLSVQSVPFTGTLSSNSVNLTLSSLLSGITISGTMGDGTLTRGTGRR